MKKTCTTPNAWAKAWLDAVASGANSMSQRKVSSVMAKGGGMKTVRALAKARGVHIVQLTDDTGNKLVAASRHRFKVIC